MSTSKLLVFSIVFVLLLSLSVVCASAANGAETAAAAIDRAQDAVVGAYAAVLDAEHAGANVTDLLAQLNAAGVLLAEAQVAYRLADFDEAERLAVLCSAVVAGVRGAADDLRFAAHGARVTGMWVALVGSLVGVFAVGVGSVWVWRVFKRRYYRRALEKTPEVSQGDA